MAFDCFLKIATIPGESTDDKHKEWIELLSFNHGVSQMTSGSVSSGGSRTAARCDHQDFSVSKSMDKASTKIALACCNGEHIGEVEVHLCRAGGNKEQYMSYKMSDVTISSAQVSGSSMGGDVPDESVGFAYGKIEWTYTELDHKTGAKKGDIAAQWDLHSNTGS